MQAAKMVSDRPRSPPTSLTSFVHCVRLKRIESEIQHLVYRVDKASRPSSELVQDFSNRLSAWKAALPPECLNAVVDKPATPFDGIDVYVSFDPPLRTGKESHSQQPQQNRWFYTTGHVDFSYIPCSQRGRHDRSGLSSALRRALECARRISDCTTACTSVSHLCRCKTSSWPVRILCITLTLLIFGG